MKRTLPTFFILITLVFTLAACSTKESPSVSGANAEPDAIPDLVGSYSLNGVDPKGEAYGGLLTIEARSNPGEYQLQWIITGAIQVGTGTVVGNQLQAEWRNFEGAETEAHGNVIYTITTNSELYGVRTAEGIAGEGTEIAFPNDEKWGDFHLGPTVK